MTSDKIAAWVLRAWAAGNDSFAIATALRHVWPALRPAEIEPLICRILNAAREARRRQA